MHRFPCSSRPLVAFLVCAAATACRSPAPQVARPASVPKPLAGEIRVVGGKPTIFVDGKPETPMIYAITDSPGGRWSWEEIPAWNIREFGKRGFRLVQASVWLQDLWREDGSVDVELVRRQLRGILDALPDAAISIRLHINAPFWWNKKHPDETTRYADVEGELHEEAWGLRRHIENDLDGRRLHSLASAQWRDDTTAVLRELLRKLAATPEGNAVIGFHLCSGVSHEWHYWGFLKHDPDTGPAMTAYFRAWLRRKYGSDEALRAAFRDPSVSLATVTVPGVEPRKNTRDGLFRDPAAERWVMDYFAAQHDVVADDILHFGKAVKEAWPRPTLVGVFYGYFFMLFSRQAAGGHLAVERVLASPYIDYLAAPQSYFSAAHGLGGSGQSRAVQESALLHGKLVIDEMDQHTSQRDPFDDEGPAEKRLEDRALIRRNTAQPLARGMGMWFYDFGPGNRTGWWGHPDFGEDIRTLKAIFDQRRDAPLEARAEVLAVWDVTSYLHFAPGWNPLSEASIDETSNDLLRSGAAVDQIFLHDLPQVDLRRYKVVVFANAWRVDAATRAFIRDRVARDGRHLVWSWAAGYTDGERNDAKLVSDLTGITVERATPPDGRPTVTVDGAIAATFQVRNNKVAPFFVVRDPAATALGRFDGTSDVGFARKPLPGGAVSWYGALPVRGPAVFRRIFREAGVHVYSDGDDALAAGNGVLWLHTATGGRRTVKLRNGQAVELELASRTTVILDEATGKILLR